TYKNQGESPKAGALSKSSTTRKYLGEKAAYVNLAKRKTGVAGFSQKVQLTGGTYTFSGYCKTVAMENASAYLKVVDNKGNMYYSNKITEETPIQFDNGWHRLSVTFTLLQGERG
ncbi:MAG: hypothetical protein IKW28_06945, partial [Lachnospiraceae bacterium]|nr:hypothetical protein [Lachnospiraceae bacterium]